MRYLSLFVIVIGCLVSAVAVAAPSWPAPIQRMADKGLTILGPFDAPGGVTGYAARAGQTPVALYLTPDGQHVIVGTMIDGNGKNLSRAALAKATGTADPDHVDVWSELEHSDWIRDGATQAPRIVYVISDPNCPYCHTFYEASRPWVAAGRVQLRQIPVGVLKPSSPGKAAALLSAANPTTAFRRHERHYKRGGIEPMADIPSALHDRITANNALMASLGIRGTPGIIYKKADGTLAIHQGNPQGSTLTDILGPKP
ncbi:thiol:disulfide interchange protein DsbG [Salinisphaera sp. Q1T1-3]|uniref:thiol:disulfide interchange protein DsbG n=1 Tax=Salinisphaera sp. Q1T1-3 TaxID=2321229 RepID=UPI000E7206E6|nr:thiol:disulfide interchange protein DsbG [Salinisphaera sp. Q1T1-3]RJS91102.1 thiol:disulfide interchange protein DsbG [Salinisphaera sp. Q1T1-3]